MLTTLLLVALTLTAAGILTDDLQQRRDNRDLRRDLLARTLQRDAARRQTVAYPQPTPPLLMGSAGIPEHPELWQ